MLPSEFQVRESFVTHEERLARLREIAAGPAPVVYRELGRSEEGREIGAVVLGAGSRKATLISGSHADEPVGSETLMALVSGISDHPDGYRGLMEKWQLLVIPHVNPDGEARNRDWISEWPSLRSYIENVVRELPGRDIEFGYPDLRVENEIVARAIREFAPVDLHMSLHGMGFSDGAMLLIERHWAFRTESLRTGFREAAKAEGLQMHDHNRKGEKGFFQIEPGYTTTPEGAAMRAYFMAAADPETAALFKDSSMEFVRSLGGNPLCVVTEMPLFLVDGPRRPGVPEAYLAFRQRLKGLTPTTMSDETVAKFPVRPLPLPVAMRLQWAALNLALQQASD